MNYTFNQVETAVKAALENNGSVIPANQLEPRTTIADTEIDSLEQELTLVELEGIYSITVCANHKALMANTDVRTITWVFYVLANA